MLPSQTTSPNGRRKHTYRRRRRRWVRPAQLAAIAIGAIAIIWAVWPSGDDEIGDDVASPTRALTPALAARQRREPPAPIESSTDPLGSEAEARTAAPAQVVERVPAEPAPAAAEPVVVATREATPDPEPQAATPPPVVMGSRAASETPAPLGNRAARDLEFDMESAPVRRADELVNEGRLVEARALLSRVLARRLAPAEADAVRRRLTRVNDTLIFSPAVVPGDPFSMHYTVQSGDSLAKISKRLSLLADWRFVQRVNNISRPERIRVGQKLKLVPGPFHAVVHKRDFRMDLYLGDIEERVYVCSFAVGLGQFDSTPTGRFRVRKHSKLINPEWVHPQTGQRFTADDPTNPIGEYWIGLEGIESTNVEAGGYGIHGTIEPDSIGRQASMGCVRMRHEDVALVYEVLMEQVSEVLIVE